MTDRPPQTESELIEHLRAIDVPAPAALHDRVEALVTGRETPPRRRWSLSAGARGATALRVAAASAMVLAAVAVALLVGQGGRGSAAAPSTRATAAFALAAPTMAAPAESPSNHAQLTVAVDGIAFPYWQEGLGWRSVGSRSDRIAGRAVTTVFYADAKGRRIGYAILGGTPPPALRGGTVSRLDGTDYRLLSLGGGGGAVVWLRNGHLCVVAGRGVSGAMLLRLASWDHGGTAA